MWRWLFVQLALVLWLGMPRLGAASPTATSPPVTVTAAPYAGPALIELSTPLDSARISAPTPVTGLIALDALDSWRVEYRLTPTDPAASASAAPWTTLATGTDFVGTPAVGATPAVPGPLATFDPTLLLNGLYQLRLAATTTDGTTYRAGPETVLVEGNLKVGHVQLTFEDLSIPVLGVPVRVIRTYDSRRAATPGDFGHGWSIATSDVKITKSRSLARGWEMIDLGQLMCPLRLEATEEHIVTVSMTPNDSFSFIAVAANKNTGETCFSSASGGTPVEMLFYPLPGTTAALEVLGDNEALLSAPLGELTLWNPHDFSDFNPTRFRLTTQDGTEYDLDAQTGLLRVATRTGETLTVGSGGYVHSEGMSIAFGRDSSGRITTITDPAGAVIHYTYDSAGDLRSVTDRVGSVQAFTYHSAPQAHHLDGITNGAGTLVARNEYDAAGRLARTVDANGNSTSYTHDSINRIETTTDRLGHSSTIEYDLRGNVVRRVDPVGAVTVLRYEDPNHPDKETSTTDAIGVTRRAEYDPVSGVVTRQVLGISAATPAGFETRFHHEDPRHPALVTRQIDPLGRETRFTYDASGNVIVERDPLGHETHITYDARGNRTSRTDPLGNRTEWDFNSWGLATAERKVRPDGTVASEVLTIYDVDLDLDHNGQPDRKGTGQKVAQTTSHTNADGTTDELVAHFDFDAQGRLAGMEFSDGSTVSQTYNALGLIATHTDERGQVTAYTYDTQGNLTRTDLPGGAAVGGALTGTFDVMGRQISATTQRGHTAIYTRDAAGRITRTTYPDGSFESTEYDLVGRVTRTLDALGRATTHAYDSRGLLTATTYPDGTTERIAYDAAGNRTGTVDRLGRASTLVFDALNHVVETRFIGQVSATGVDLDPTDNTVSTSVRDAIGQLLYTVDAAGRRTDFAYDATCGCSGRRSSETDALGHTRTTTYDELGNKVTDTDALGRVTRFTYSLRQRLTGIVHPDGTTTRFEHDPAGNLLRSTDQLGHVTDYAYDPLGRATRQRRYLDYTPAGLPITTNPARIVETTFLYDIGGNLIAQTDANGNATTFVYDAFGRRTRRTDALGHATNFTYDAAGNLRSETDAQGRITSYEYDANNFRFRTTHPDGAVEETRHNAAGLQTSLTDPLGRSTAFTYDTRRRLIQTTDAFGHSTDYEYDLAGNRTAQVDALGRRTTYEYNLIDHLTAVVHPGGSRQLSGYDALGRLVSSTDETGRVTRNRHDAMGRLVEVRQYLTAAAAAADADFSLPSTHASLVSTRYTYDERGLRTEQRDARGSLTTFAYDTLGRLVLKTLPEGQTERYTYDLAGNLATRTDGNGRTTTFHYDPRNQLTRRAADPAHPSLTLPHAPASIEFAYDAVGRRLSAATYPAAGFGTAPIHRETFTYDSRGRLETKSTPYGALVYTYDASGNIIGAASDATAHGFEVDYAYDQLNRLARVDDVSAPEGSGVPSAARSSSYTYDEVGNLATLRYANGTLHSYDYDARNRLHTLAIGLSAGPSSPGGNGILGQTFTTDASGRRTAIAEATGRTVAYHYDAQARLIQEVVTADPFGANGTNDYDYDSVGNRRQRTGDLGARPPQAFSYTANDWLVGDTYDANGNTRVPAPTTRARDPLTAQLPLIATQDIYDFEDRLIRRQRADGSALDYIYSADGDRVRKIVFTPFIVLDEDTCYLIDTQSPGGLPQVVEERHGPAATAPARVYVHGLSTISQSQWLGTPGAEIWTTHYYHHDGQSSVRALTDAAGQVTDTYAYDAYGNVLARTGAATPNTRFYAGEEYDSHLGLYYLRARYMNPETGRFHTRDSFTGYAEDPRSLHLYTYAFADPVNFRDPSGHYPMGAWAMVGYMGLFLATIQSYTDLMLTHVRASQGLAGAGNLANVGAAAEEGLQSSNPAQFFAAAPRALYNVCSKFANRLRSEDSGPVGLFVAEIAGCMCNIASGSLSGFTSALTDAVKGAYHTVVGAAKALWMYAPLSPWAISNIITDAPKFLVTVQTTVSGLISIGKKLFDGSALDVLKDFSPDLYNVVMAAIGESAKNGITYDQVCTSIGNVLGGAIFEIVMAVVTAGASGALKAIKCSKLVVGAVDWVDDLAPDSSVTRYLRKHTGCFVAGTLIWTAAGAMPIEQVGLGAPMQTSAEHADPQTPETRASDARRTLQVKVTFVETDTGGQAMELVTWVPPEWFPEFGNPESAIGQVRYLEDYGFAGEIAKLEVLATREAGDFADAPVVVATSRRDGPIPKVELRLADQPEAGEGSEPLRITTEHPVYSISRSGWIHAGALAVGETVPTRDGGETQVASVRTYVDETPVFNLEVSDHHNYFAGASGVLVHNTNDKCGVTALDIKTTAGPPGSLALQRSLAGLTKSTRDLFEQDFSSLRKYLKPGEIDSIAAEPWRMRLFFGTAVERRVAELAATDDTLSFLHHTVNNAPQDFIAPNGVTFDITGNSRTSIMTHFKRPGTDAVVVYDSISGDLGFKFVKWLNEQ